MLSVARGCAPLRAFLHSQKSHLCGQSFFSLGPSTHVHLVYLQSPNSFPHSPSLQPHVRRYTTSLPPRQRSTLWTNGDQPRTAAKMAVVLLVLVVVGTALADGDPEQLDVWTLLESQALLSVMTLLCIPGIPATFKGLSLSPLALGLGIGLGVGLFQLFCTVAAMHAPLAMASASHMSHLGLTACTKPEEAFCLSLGAGVGEEALFRGLVLPVIGFNPIGLVVSTALFTAPHMRVSDDVYTAWVAFYGTGLGLSMLVTANLAVPVVASIVLNFLCITQHVDTLVAAELGKASELGKA
eukprot:NODE_973_length_1194_cov_70.127511_g735_i0.p1 GENE.NODE_973_length_1194_cov_70.127511_g735_i0~~NODE_973_length_1194_cov_70.127511_g735_i0.p1  ORF type:complete len:315 (-),score=81.81 NODE_973_length_1194_cov_70.127511_g735_i0:249-1139(-)